MDIQIAFCKHFQLRSINSELGGFSKIYLKYCQEIIVVNCTSINKEKQTATSKSLKVKIIAIVNILSLCHFLE